MARGRGCVAVTNYLRSIITQLAVMNAEREGREAKGWRKGWRKGCRKGEEEGEGHTCAVRTETSQEFKSYVLLNAHLCSVNLENVASTLYWCVCVWGGEGRV